MKRLILLSLGVLLLPVFSPAQQAHSPDLWGQYKFLLGKWTADATGEPGEGKGFFSFAVELQGKILVRRGHTDFPATPQRAAFSHEDLLVVYAEPGASDRRATYFDSEGHVIQYHTKFEEQGKVLIFTSDPAPGSPSFRLTYRQGDSGVMKVNFAIAPPGKPEALTTHVEGMAHRTEPGARSQKSE